MPDLSLTNDLTNDLKTIFSNPRKVFPQNQSITFDLNYVLLNTMWKDYGFKYENRERVGLSYAIGNFYSSYFKVGFKNDPYQVLLAGWSDLYEYYILNKNSGKKFALKESEPHFLLSLISTSVVFEETNLDDNSLFNEFFNAMDPFLSTWQNLDNELANSIISDSYLKKLEELYTWGQYIDQIKHSINNLNGDVKLYYSDIVKNEKLIYNDYKKLYKNVLWIFESQIKYWRKGEFLFDVNKDGSIIIPSHTYSY